MPIAKGSAINNGIDLMPDQLTLGLGVTRPTPPREQDLRTAGARVKAALQGHEHLGNYRPLAVFRPSSLRALSALIPACASPRIANSGRSVRFTERSELK